MIDKEDEKSMDIQVNDAKPEDVEGIFEVQYRTWLETYPDVELGITREDIEERFQPGSEKWQERVLKRKETIDKEEKGHTWVAKDGEKVVGFCYADKGDEKNKIGAIYILPEYQGKKLGGKLISEAFKWLGEGDIYVDVASYNQNAIDFYKRYGFESIGEIEPMFKFDSGVFIPEIRMKRAGK